MNVSASNSNNYQMLNQYQLQNNHKRDASIQPVPEHKYTNSEIYEASRGNLIRNDEGQLTLTPQGKTNINNAQEARAAEEAAAAQAKQDERRGNVVDYVERQSKKSQVEIYLSVATDSKVELGNDSAVSIIESLRDVQKQNNAIQAYAAYQEN